MAKRILILLVVSLALFITPSWAVSSPNCTTAPPDDVVTIMCLFSSSVTAATFDFGTDGVITFQFDTVLTSFELDVSAVVNPSSTTFTGPDFPASTACIPYDGAGGNGGFCVRYNVTSPGGSVPVKGVNFRGLVTVLLNYASSPIFDGIPAFGHAPGDSTTAAFSENILTFYVDPNASNCTNSCGEIDPGMGGKVPNISSFEAFKLPFTSPVPTSGYTVCNVPPTSTGLTASFQNSNSNNPIVEVSFRLVASGGDCVNGPFLRDKTATLSVASSGSLTVAPLINGGDSNKFHFDSHNGVNVQDINTNGNNGNSNGLQSGNYYVTVISTLFSPITTTFAIP
jgi:hypothetical protein